jgi:hypothetical protein
MGGGREIPTLISTAAIVEIVTTIASAKSIVPKSNFFNFVASFVLPFGVCDRCPENCLKTLHLDLLRFKCLMNKYRHQLPSLQQLSQSPHGLKV